MSYFENFLKANQAYVELHGDLHLSIKPKTKVAITSILPADSSNKKAMARINNQRISAYNAGLADLANEFGIPFIDLRPYLKAHPDFYEGDGIHLNRNFYRYWLKFIQENYKEA